MKKAHSSSMSMLAEAPIVPPRTPAALLPKNGKKSTPPPRPAVRPETIVSTPLIASESKLSPNSQLDAEHILLVLTSLKRGDFSVRLPVTLTGIGGRVAREVGTEGKLGGQAKVKGVAGTWKDLTDNVNLMASNLTSQVRNIATVTTAVANGDLAKKITVDVRGEFLELKDTINTMVDQLRSFASEVTRVAREVGTEGALGGQAKVKGVSGTWKDS